MNENKCPICDEPMQLAMDVDDGFQVSFHCPNCHYWDEAQEISIDEFNEILDEIFSQPSDKSHLN